MSDTNKQVELIRTSFLKNLAAVHPLKEHPIDKCEEYVQKLYIDALTVISQYENPNAEDTNRFIQRIMAGAGLKEPFTEHLKNALEITPERYGEFLKQCTENKLTDIFLIDSIIIGCAGGEPNKKQVDFIAETADMLSVNKRRFKWLVGLAKSILLQSNEEYKTASDAIPHDEKNEIIPQIVCYLKEFVCKCEDIDIIQKIISEIARYNIDALACSLEETGINLDGGLEKFHQSINIVINFIFGKVDKNLKKFVNSDIIEEIVFEVDDSTLQWLSEKIFKEVSLRFFGEPDKLRQCIYLIYLFVIRNIVISLNKYANEQGIKYNIDTDSLINNDKTEINKLIVLFDIMQL